MGAKVRCWGGSLSLLHTVITICCRLEQEAGPGLQRLDITDARSHIVGYEVSFHSVLYICTGPLRPQFLCLGLNKMVVRSFFLSWVLYGTVLNLSLRSGLNQSLLYRNVSARSAPCHMALPETQPLWEHRRLVALWGHLSANLFCVVNKDKRVWALFTSTAQAVIVRAARNLANFNSVRSERQRGRATHKKWGGRRWKRVSEEELGWAFYHRAIIQCLVNTDEKLSSNTLTVLHGDKQSWWKGSCSSHQGQLVWLCIPAGAVIVFLLS